MILLIPYGYLWILYKDIYGYLWIFMDIYGYIYGFSLCTAIVLMILVAHHNITHGHIDAHFVE